MTDETTDAGRAEEAHAKIRDGMAMIKFAHKDAAEAHYLAGLVADKFGHPKVAHSHRVAARAHSKAFKTGAWSAVACEKSALVNDMHLEDARR